MDHQKIFFSYSRDDASNFAFRLYFDLKNAGANVWIDQSDIFSGARWYIEKEKALKDCQCVLFIISEKAVDSDNIMDEVYYALNKKKRVVLVIKSTSPIPEKLKSLQQIDFTSDYKEGLNYLLHTFNLEKQTK
jgi:hypothetical protein